MGFSINTNNLTSGLTLSINATLGNLYKSMTKLSTGLKINSAADDPAGLIISEQMRSRIASLNQEIENTSVTLNKYRTADSALLQQRRLLTDMRSNALAAANSGYNDEATRMAYQNASDDLIHSFNSLTNSTSFGNQKLLDGSEGSAADVAELENFDLSSAESAEQAVAEIDQAIAEIDRSITEVGSRQTNELESRMSNLRVEVQNLTAAESSIRDVDYAVEYSNFVRHSLLLQSGLSLMAHAQTSHSSVIKLLSS